MLILGVKKWACAIFYTFSMSGNLCMLKAIYSNLLNRHIRHGTKGAIVCHQKTNDKKLTDKCVLLLKSISVKEHRFGDNLEEIQLEKKLVAIQLCRLF